MVLLREVTEEDLSTFYENQCDGEANQMATVEAKSEEAFMAHWAKILSDETVITKSVIFDGQLAGDVLSWNDSGRRKVGYWLGRDYWGQGIASQAVAQFLDLVTERPLFADVAEHNKASLRILQKCGFLIIGEHQVPFGPAQEEITLLFMQLGH